MPRTLLYILILILTLHRLNSFSQIDIKNLQLSNLDTNILYIGVDNNLKITGVDNSLLEMISNNCTIRRINNSEFILKANVAGLDTLKIYKKNKLLFKKTFHVISISTPIVHFARIKSDEATIQEIISDPTLVLIIPNYFYVHNLTVCKFSGYFIKKNGDIIGRFSSQTNRFLNVDLNTISNLHSGDKIHFENIDVKTPDNLTKAVQPFELKIK